MRIKKNAYPFGGFASLIRLLKTKAENMNERIHKYFYKELSAKERLSLLRDVEVNKELKKEFTEYQNLYALLNLGHQVQDKTIGKLKYDHFILQKRHTAMWKCWTHRIGYAAAILFLVVSTGLLTYWYAWSEQTEFLSENLMNTLYTPAGQRAKLFLQDGTEVWLNAKSKLIYPARFTGDKRNVTVEGEAFFKVAKDPSRPFIVSTHDVNMEVLGTQFNVCCYPATGYVQTSLLEGSVHVFFRNKESDGVILRPDQQVTVSNGRMKVEPIRLKDHFLWRDGIYAFENEPLINILEKMEYYYDVRIIVKDASLFKDTYTGKFRQRDSLDDVFRVLQQIRRFKVEKDTERNIVTLK